MMLVTLGTQNKPFSRLLEKVEEEIKKGVIKDKVIAQTGTTKFSSTYMEVLDFVPMKQFDTLLNEADLIITHGGVGSILGAIRKNKKVIAIARDSKYKEHTNDHQKQIVEEFSKKGYIMSCDRVEDLGLALKQIETFTPVSYQAGNQRMLTLITNFIEQDRV